MVNCSTLKEIHMSDKLNKISYEKAVGGKGLGVDIDLIFWTGGLGVQWGNGSVAFIFKLGKLSILLHMWNR